MGRLIDADKVVEHLEKVKKESASLVDMAHILGFQSVIDVQPTAYDPDKVVEQLEKLKKAEQLEKLKKAEQDRSDDCDEDGYGDGEQIYDDGRIQGKFEAFGKAIEIVKGGGVD